MKKYIISFLIILFLSSCIATHEEKEFYISDANDPKERFLEIPPETDVSDVNDSKEVENPPEKVSCLSPPQDKDMCHPLYVPEVAIEKTITTSESTSPDFDEDWTLSLPPRCSPTPMCCWDPACLCQITVDFPFNFVFSHPPKTPIRFIYQINEGSTLEFESPASIIGDLRSSFLRTYDRTGRNYSRFRFKLIWTDCVVGAEFFWHEGKHWMGSGFCEMEKIDIFVGVPSKCRR